MFELFDKNGKSKISGAISGQTPALGAYIAFMPQDYKIESVDDALDDAFGKAYENFINNCINKIQCCATELDGKPVISLQDFKSFMTSPSYELRK